MHVYSSIATLAHAERLQFQFYCEQGQQHQALYKGNTLLQLA